LLSGFFTSGHFPGEISPGISAPFAPGRPAAAPVLGVAGRFSHMEIAGKIKKAGECV
jgi:hypothetical protein